MSIKMMPTKDQTNLKKQVKKASGVVSILLDLHLKNKLKMLVLNFTLKADCSQEWSLTRNFQRAKLSVSLILPMPFLMN
jgi:hypothetical protein